MLKRLRSWLEERTGVAGGQGDSPVRPIGQPTFEPLEPRVLLNADLAGTDSLLSLESSLQEQAIVVDLQQEGDPIEPASAEIFSLGLSSSPAEQFTGGTDSFDLAYQAVLFTPGGAGYSFAVRSITALPTSPESGTRLMLDDDDGVLVSLGSGARVVLYGRSYDTFYIGSNGCITFGQPDTSYSETLERHFEIPRIAALYDDLNPGVGGQISYSQLSDRVVVTWEQVPDYSNGGGCTFQVTMYFDGRIELAWLAVASPDGIVGLSDGSGLVADFTEIDFSNDPSTAPEITALGNGLSIADGDTAPSPDNHTDFGSVVRGGPAISRTFTVRNDGTATLTLGAVTVPAGFTLTEGLSSSLAPGESDTFTVRLDTAVAGTKAGDISFATNDSDENPFNFRVTGTVIAGPELTVLGDGVSIPDGDTTPSTGDHTDFGSAVQGGTAISRTFTVRNDGGSTLTLGAVLVPEGFTLTEGLSSSLAPGASDTFTVQLDTAVAGTKTGDISFVNDDSDENPFHFRITGTVIAGPEITVLGNGVPIADGAMTPSKSDHTDFGSGVQNGITISRTFTVRNDGGSTLTLGAVTVPAGYILIEGLSASLAPGESDTFTVRLDPMTAGVKSGDIVFATNDPDERSFNFRITGEVVPTPSAIVTSVSSVSIAEGSTTTFWVKLLAQPGDSVVVSVGRFGGDTDIAIASGASLTFTTSNWDTYQTVTLTAAEDADQADGTAVIRCSAAGLADMDVTVIERDDDMAQAVYRFWSPTYARHFYTISVAERDKLINRYADAWTYEGPAYYAFTDGSQAGLSAVYRFWSDKLGSHFYTMNPGERDKLLKDPSHVWTYEGVAFYAYPAGSQPAGTSAVYRFWSGSLGSHFFTMSAGERDKLINDPSHAWTYEIIAWYAYPA